MKKIFIMLVTLLAVNSFAGNGSGTMMTMQQIVYNIDRQDGIVRYAVGNLKNNQYQIQKIEVSENAISGNMKLMNALDESKKVQNWVGIKN